jgi:hypothetical protein
VAHEAATQAADLPGFVSIAPVRRLGTTAHGPGFLGPRYAPLIVGDAASNYGSTERGDPIASALRVPNLTPHEGVADRRIDGRLRLLQQVQDEFVSERPSAVARSHQTVYQQAARLMRSEARKAFELDTEPARLRDTYGRNPFGQGCLLARRLVERGVAFVEVVLGGTNGFGWDTHQNNFEMVRDLSAVLDLAWATLMEDLKARGLLESTLIVWIGEFGRTPTINGDSGRDRFPKAWSAVLGGGGIKGGQVVGKTSQGGDAIEQRPVSVPDLLATVCLALGIEPTKTNQSNVGRPISIVDKAARPLKEIVATHR